MINNPKRPPRGWFRRCMKGVQKSGARQPGAVCGSLWYNKLGDADRRRVMREEEGYAENPSNGALIAGGAAAAAVIAWVFWPKKAAAQTPVATKACGTDYEVKSFGGHKGLILQIVDNAPKNETPPSGYDAEYGRIYNRSDCSFYRYFSLDGSMSTWMKDTSLNAEFAAWKAPK